MKHSMIRQTSAPADALAGCVGTIHVAMTNGILAGVAALALALAAAVPKAAASTVTVSISMAEILDATGNKIPTASMFQLVNLGADGEFNPIPAGTWVGGDDAIVAVTFSNSDGWANGTAFDLTDGTGVAGEFDRCFTFVVGAGVAPGDKLGIRWFPTVTAANYATTTPPAGMPYGQFTRQSSPLYGGAVWVIPAPGNWVSFDPLVTASYDPEQGSDSGALSRASNAILPGESGFGPWATAAGLFGAAAEPAASPFNDAVPNLLKYAFNMRGSGPDVSRLVPATGTAGLPTIWIRPDGWLVVEFIRHKAARNPGVFYVVETGEDLARFTRLSLAGASVAAIDNLWERVTVIDPVVTPRRFARVRIESAASYANDFNTTLGTVTLRGTATWINQAVQLTDTARNQRGAIVLDGVTAGPEVNGFSAKFDLALGPAGGALPAEGVSFAVGDLGDGPWGESGPGTAGSFALGFDTSGIGLQQARGIHVWVNGNHLVHDMTNPYTNGVGVPVEISYDSASGLTVRFNGELVFDHLPMPGFSFPADSRFGFGARTGASNQRAVVDNIDITTR